MSEEKNENLVADDRETKTPESVKNISEDKTEKTSPDVQQDEQSDSMKEAELQAEEAKLDELDNAPENKRRARIILYVIAVLFLFAIVAIIVFPPLGWSPQKGMKSEFHTVSAVENIQTGANPELDLIYQPVSGGDESESKSLQYALNLKQTTNYDNGAYVRIEMDAHIVMTKPAKHDREDEIDIQLQNVDIRLFDGEKEVPMASTNAMISGISVRALLDSKNGMSSIIPPATKINPQTARILFIVSDALRQIFPPLPKEKVGNGATWEVRDLSNEAGEFVRHGFVKASEVQSQGTHLDVNLLFYQAGDLEAPIGIGEIRSDMSEGRVKKADVHYHRTKASYSGGGSEQDTELRFSLEE